MQMAVVKYDKNICELDKPNSSENKNGLRVDFNRFLIRIDVAMYHQHGYRCHNPHFVVKISLTYKTGLLILHNTKRNYYQNFTPHAKSLKFPILHTWKMINLSLKNSVFGR